MDNRELEQLKQEYMNIQVPEELDFIVENSISHGKKVLERKRIIKRIKIASASVAASIVILVAGVNISPALAITLSNIPIVGSVVRVLTFREYKVDEDKYHAEIHVPEIRGLDNKELENSLNEKYLTEGKELYDMFMEEMKEIEKMGGGYLGMDNGYVIKTDTYKILSIGRYVVNTVGSSSTTFEFDTIDKEKHILITLPSLFKDESYIDIISENIKYQMKEQMKDDEMKFYWIEGEEEAMNPFDKISKDQSFYISSENKLVICFNKYDVAPGYMGTPEFIIPTEIISDELAGSEYIK